MKKTFSLIDSVCLYTNIKELSCADLDEEFVFFGCRRMLIRQKFIKSKGRAILDEEDIFSHRQRMLIRRDEKNDLFAKRADPKILVHFPVMPNVLNIIIIIEHVKHLRHVVDVVLVGKLGIGCGNILNFCGKE